MNTGTGFGLTIGLAVTVQAALSLMQSGGLL